MVTKFPAVRVEVTGTDIVKGTRRSQRESALARAIKRATGRTDVRVGIDAIYFGPRHPRQSCYLPLEAACFDADWDWGRPVLPFAFEIRPPFEVVR